MDRGVELEWCWGGVGWCYVFVISVRVLVQFDMVLDGFGPSWCFGILWGMDALVPDPSTKKRLANQDGCQQFIGLMDQLRYPLMPLATTGWFDPQHNQSPRGNNSPRHQYQGVPVPPWWKNNLFFPHPQPGSASVAWGGGISLPRWNQGMVPWRFGVHEYAEGSKVTLLFKLINACDFVEKLRMYVNDFVYAR